MDEKTLEALKGSIRKWEAIVAGTGVDEGGDNCPLCQLFSFSCDEGDYYCYGCPVMLKTGHDDCRTTPYYAYRANKTTENAQAELDFLKSLLPPGEGERSQTALSEDRTGHSDSAQTTKA